MNTTTGAAVRGCCHATNQCQCARDRFMRETTRMLVLDAIEQAPTIFAVLTAREFLTKNDDLKRTFAHMLRVLRRRWPVEWFCRWEEQARGALHVNLLVKGVPASEWGEFREQLVAEWCRRVDAEPAGQYVEAIEDGTAVTLYVAEKVRHAGKANQEPRGWKWKHRTSQTRGYLVRPASVMREEARRSLRLEALTRVGVDEQELDERLADGWKLVNQIPGRNLDAERRRSARAPFLRPAA